jgi:hypothetical protein
LAAGVVSTLTDWLFAGDWIHRRYTYLEIWRQGGEGRAIALTSALPFLTCGVFAYITASGAVKLAFAVWLIGLLPLILTNAAFMKLHRVFVASYATEWLVKLCDRCSRSWLVPSLTPTGESIVSFGSQRL